jgi:UPF0271 protein
MPYAIDLNADVGEGLGPWRCGDDAKLISLVSSASVACGFHAGDPTIMRETCLHAVNRGVQIGAHVGYPDLLGFGRREMSLTEREIHDSVVVQIGSLLGCALSVGTRVSYVKLHGALYHRAATDARAAEAVVAAVHAVDAGLSILGPPRSALSAACASRGVTLVTEGFADRAYLADGGLAPRSWDGSVLRGERAARQAVSLVLERRVPTTDGLPIELAVQSLCVHGDSPEAVRTARSVVDTLREAGVSVRAFG